MPVIGVPCKHGLASNSKASNVTSVQLNFSEDMDPDSFSPSTFVVTDEDGHPVAGSDAGTSLHIEHGLPVGTYTARVAGVTDALGNRLRAPYEWSFTVMPDL